MLEIFLIAQISTSDWVCWMDMGYGPIDMSYLCGSALATSSSLSDLPTATTNAVSSPNSSLAVSRSFLPAIRACMESEAYLNNLSTDECALRVPVVATFSTPGGQLEIIEDREYGDFWVRVPDDEYGFGPFERRSNAQEWAKTNFIEFF
jgi:hypothetical protein